MGACVTKDTGPAAAGGATLISAGSLHSQPTASGHRKLSRGLTMSPTSPSSTPSACPILSPTKEARGGLALTNAADQISYSDSPTHPTASTTPNGTDENKNNRSVDSPDAILKNTHRRRRLSLSQSAPINPDGVENDFRGKFLIQQQNAVQAAAREAASSLAVDNDDQDANKLYDPDLLSSSDEENETENATEQRAQRVPPSRGCRRLSVCGALTSNKQGQFESKRQEVKGDTEYFDSTTLLSLGIGYVCKKGLKPESPNQDDFFIVRIDDWALYGVFDGHGPYGHNVSNFVQRELPKIISDNENFFNNPKEALRQAFIRVHEMASCAHGLFDCTNSGSTATVVLHRKSLNKLNVAHVGDSRCILGKLSKNGRKIEAVDLTHDHKPNLEQEKKRIVASGGQVRKDKGEIPYRVFLKGLREPGLAMSRAIGDLQAAQIGVTCHPDVSEYTIDPSRDLFIVLCSDGVWEFLSSQDVAEVVHAGGIQGAQTAAEILAARSWNAWIKEEEDVVDDITAQVIYLNPEALI